MSSTQLPILINSLIALVLTIILIILIIVIIMDYLFAFFCFYYSQQEIGNREGREGMTCRKVPQVGIVPLATVARPQPLYKGRPLYQMS